ncbi:PepSY domain-containing protein [Nocardia anaemiae]|uniref:PepSY domain-containing protein n=1 Tax=Nocardia anaemiae TaxID=263910 RepID=UPI0007A46B5F|nr:PepSY domain-containing protein [Nocardia anaemiae]
MSSVIRRAFASLRWIIVGAAVVGATVAGLALATSTVGHKDHTVAVNVSATDLALLADPQISRQQAIDEAVRAVPGSTVDSAEIDADRGVWEVELSTPDGVEHEVSVDVKTGKVVGTVEHD